MVQERFSIHTPTKRGWLAIFLVDLLIILTIGYWFLQTEIQDIRQERFQDLAAIGQLKVNQVVEWRKERRSDATNLSESSLFIKALKEWLAQPTNLSLQEEIRQRLEVTFRAFNYANIILVDPEGKILLSVVEEAEPVSVETKQTMKEALARGKASLSDLYRSASGGVYLDSITPVLEGRAALLGVLILRSDARSFLFPFLQSWPTPSRTAETFLVKREGGEILFLNDLRHREGAAMSLRLPLSQTSLLSVQAILGKEGNFEGKDYRGVKVLADLRPVPDSPWFIVAKMDSSEIPAEARYQSTKTIAIMALLILIGALLTSLGFRLQKARFFRSLYLAEKKRCEAQEELRTTLYSIGDAVISTDQKGMVKVMNPIAERLTGWSEAEAEGKPLAEIFHIIHEETRAEAENPVQRVLQEGIVVGLANHSVLIARDGREIPIADAGAPIRDDRGTILGVVLVFRDQTEERAGQQALKEAKEFAESIIATIREPLVVLDAEMRVISANRSFYATFQAKPEETEGRQFYDLDNRKWDIPQLRELLENILPQNTSLTDFEVEHDFPHLGTRTILLNARRIYREANKTQMILLAIEDITQRKRAEQALRFDREQLLSIFNSLDDPIYVSDPMTYEVLYANKALKDAFGKDPIGGLCFREFQGLESPCNFCTNEIILKNRYEPYAWEYHNPILNRDFRIVDRIIRWPDGRDVRFEMAIDVTDRKRAEEALRQSEEKYRILHEFAGEAIFTFATDLNLMEINKAACDYVGYKREELLGQNIFELGILHPEDIARATENLAKVLSGQKPVVVDKLRFKGKHGLYGTFQVTSTPVIRKGETIAITNVCRDVTIEERLYSALEASERRYRFLFNAGNDAVFVYKMTEDKKPEKFIEVNDLASTLTGYSKAELLELTPFDLVAPEEKNEVLESNHIISEKKHRVFERTLLTKKGQRIPCEVSSHFFELNGVPTVLAIARDITERKKAEESLKAALKEKDIMLREIHHRVKNNMQIMSSLLRLQARQVHDKKAQEAFKESQTRIRSMAMIHEKLYQSRDFASIDFADYIEKMVTHLYVVYHVDPRRVLFKEDVRSVDLDINRAIPCGLIVNELVSNALKYAFTGEKKGELSVTMFKDEAGKHHLLVKDTGVGLPKNIDIHRAQTLGLQIVSDLTKQLEGKVEVRRDGGTEFEIVF